MKKQFFKEVLDQTLSSIKQTLGVKAMEYIRNDNAMHNFDVGARITGQTREKVLYGFALKHQISIDDIRNDLDQGKLPTIETVNEKFGDAINYLILEKASILHKISNQAVAASISNSSQQQVLKSIYEVKTEIAKRKIDQGV